MGVPLRRRGRPTETRHALTERSLGIWHGALPGVAPGQRYGFRADGPWDPGRGLRFNPHKLLLDPYARAVSGEFVTDPADLRLRGGDDRRHRTTSRCATSATRRRTSDAAWSSTTTSTGATTSKIGARWRDTRRSTSCTSRASPQLHDRIPEELRGTYAGLGHPVVTDYLRDLGVTAVELLPMQQFVSEPRARRRTG